MFTPELNNELQKPLNEKYVKVREVKGERYSYITSHHAIREANTIFGNGGWSYELNRLDCVATEKNQRGNNVITYLAVVTVSVGGVSRQDTGSGSGIGPMLGACHEGATKEAVSDALKRCLRTFGDRFGLALYDNAREYVVTDAEAKRIDVTEKNKALMAALRSAIKRKDKDDASDKFKQCVKAGIAATGDAMHKLCLLTFPPQIEEVASPPAKTADAEKIDAIAMPIKNCKTVTAIKDSVKKVHDSVKSTEEFKKVVKDAEDKITNERKN